MQRRCTSHNENIVKIRYKINTYNKSINYKFFTKYEPFCTVQNVLDWIVYDKYLRLGSRIFFIIANILKDVPILFFSFSFFFFVSKNIYFIYFIHLYIHICVPLLLFSLLFTCTTTRFVEICIQTKYCPKKSLGKRKCSPQKSRVI